MKGRKTIKTPESIDSGVGSYFILPVKVAGKDIGYAVYQKINWEYSTRCAQFGTGMESLKAALAECERLEAAYFNTSPSVA